MFTCIKLFLLLVFCTAYLLADEEVIVEIPDGKVKGRIQVTLANTTFYSFQGIPFAKPPLNELRFKAPQPVEPWDDVLDATHEKNICFQVTNDRDDESEDCLIINVFSPKAPSSDGDPLPVMFFIYGGGFVEGSSEDVNYGPDHLMPYDVVLVTFNYRVGPFGFFSTGDSAIPGNAGLKDQTFALQWVQKNIQYFGGDPEKVTIFGQSAGGASVAYQMLNPKAKGLFRAAICESGSFLSPWAYQRSQVEMTYRTAQYLNASINAEDVSTSELLEYLMNLDAKDLDKASHSLASTESVDYMQLVQGFFYAPVIEYEHEDAFITKTMFDSLKGGDFNQVPLMIGIDSEECMFYADDESFEKTLAESYDDIPSRLLPFDMHIEDDEVAVETQKAITELYVGNATFADNPRNIIKFLSDTCFTRSVIKHAELQSQYTDVYFYQFSYRGVLGGQTTEPVEGFSDIARHGEELGYIFRRNYEGYNTTDLSLYPESDIAVLKRVLTLFTNFAKVLNPTPEESELLENIIWPTVDADDFSYLDIGSYSLIRQNPKKSSYGGWNAIYERYGVEPFDTY